MFEIYYRPKIRPDPVIIKSDGDKFKYRWFGSMSDFKRPRADQNQFYLQLIEDYKEMGCVKVLKYE